MISRIFAAVALLVAALTFFFYINPTWAGDIATAKATIASDDQALVAAEQYSNKENQLISAKKLIKPELLARLSTFLPNSPGDVQLILDLDSLAARSGLTLNSISIADTSGSNNNAIASGKAYNSIETSLSASGSYASFRSFLTSIEHSARLLDVTSLSVTGSNTGVYNYSMTLRLYWLQ